MIIRKQLLIDIVGTVIDSLRVHKLRSARRTAWGDDWDRGRGYGWRCVTGLGASSGDLGAECSKRRLCHEGREDRTIISTPSAEERQRKNLTYDDALAVSRSICRRLSHRRRSVAVTVQPATNQR
jgi:hypothetical protein